MSLSVHDKELYNQICRPKFENAFESIVEFIEQAKRKFDIEVTAVTIPEVDIAKIGEIARKMGVKLRMREYIPCSW